MPLVGPRRVGHHGAMASDLEISEGVLRTKDGSPLPASALVELAERSGFTDLFGYSGELAYAQATAAQNTITAITDLTSLSIEFDVPAEAVVEVEGFLPWLPALAGDITLNITDWANTVKAYTVTSQQTPAGTDYAPPIRIMERIDTRAASPLKNADAGHFQRKLRLTGTAAVSVGGNLATIVSWLKATRVAVPFS